MVFLLFQVIHSGWCTVDARPLLHALPFSVSVFASLACPLALSFGACFLAVAEIIVPPLSTGVASKYCVAVASDLTCRSTLRARVSGGLESDELVAAQPFAGIKKKGRGC